MPFTLEDIAQISGFSRSTVSRVINGDSNVSEKTRERIMETVRKYKYQPNLTARALAVGRTNIIGLIIPVSMGSLFSDPFFQTLIFGVTSSCNARDYSLILWIADPEFDQRPVANSLYNSRFDGIVVTSMTIDDPIVDSLSKHDLPFIMIGRHPTCDQLSYVDADNHFGARQAVIHLVDAGRKRIGTITGPRNTIPGIDRYQGYIDALHESGITEDVNLVSQADFTEIGGYSAMQRLLVHKPDAVFAASDAMAIGAMQAVKDAGLQIPQDVAFVGYDNIPLARQAIPPLTTIRQPAERMAVAAVELLIDRIEGNLTVPQHIVFPTELIVRESCGTKK
jgi:LacI family transcriptional regulator